MTEFRALVEGLPGHLITPNGTYPITRVYWDGAQFNLGDGNGRSIIVGEQTLSVSYDPMLGLEIRTTNYVVFLPSHCVKASWKP